MLINFQGVTGMVRFVRWDRHSLTAFGGSASLAAGAAMLLADASAALVPVIGMVVDSATMALANHDRADGRTRRGQLRRVYSWPSI
jgi:hypothetical protein